MVGISSTPMMHLHCLNLSITTAIVPPSTNGVLGARLLTIVGSFPLQTNCPSPTTLDFSKMNNTFSSCRKSLRKNTPMTSCMKLAFIPVETGQKLLTDACGKCMVSEHGISLCLPASPAILQQFDQLFHSHKQNTCWYHLSCLRSSSGLAVLCQKKTEDTTSMYKPTPWINPENSVIIDDDTQVPLATETLPSFLELACTPMAEITFLGLKVQAPFRSVSWSISLSEYLWY